MMNIGLACLAALSWGTLVSAKCKTFTPSSYNASTTRVGPRIPVSKGVTCDASQQTNCGVGAASRTLRNVSTILDSTSGNVVSMPAMFDEPLQVTEQVGNDLFELIARTFNTTFYNPLQYNVSYGYSLSPGQSGWVYWAGLYECHLGTFNDCSGDGYPASGVIVTACSASIITTGDCKQTGGKVDYRCARGEIGFQNSTADDARNLVCDACTNFPSKDNTVVLGNSAGRTRTSVAVIAAVVAAAFLL